MTDTDPLVTVIAPVYNGEKLIRRALTSVLHQTWSNLELIVVDDGSTDGTAAVIEDLQRPEITLLRQKNRGVAAARNAGFRVSRGGYLKFLDADDLLFPDAVETDMRVALNAPNPVCVVYGGYYCVDHRERLIRTWPIRRRAGDILPDVLRDEGVLLNDITLLHREVVEGAGGFDEALRFHEDRAFYTTVAKRFPAFPTLTRKVIYRQELSGKGRRAITQFETGLEAQERLVEALRRVLDPEEWDIFRRTAMNALFCRFVMYGFMDSARRMLPHIDREQLRESRKGHLALLSVRHGINLLRIARYVYQGVATYAMLPWWRRFSREAYKAATPPPSRFTTQEA